MPRIGLAYRLSEKTVIRTGYGIYYNVHQLNNYTILNLNPPLSGSAAFSNTASDGVITNSNPITSQNPFGVLSPTSMINANTLNRNDFEPRLHQWSFGVQRQLPWAVGARRRLRRQQGRPHRQHRRVQQPGSGTEFAAYHAPAAPAVSVRNRWPGRPSTASLPHPLSRFRWQFLVSRPAGRLPEALQPRPDQPASLTPTASPRARAMAATKASVSPTTVPIRTRAIAPRTKAVYPFDAKHNAVISWLYEMPTRSRVPQRCGAPDLWRLAGQRHLDPA